MSSLHGPNLPCVLPNLLDVQQGTTDKKEIGSLSQELVAKGSSKESYEEKIGAVFENGCDIAFPSKCSRSQCLMNGENINPSIKVSEKRGYNELFQITLEFQIILGQPSTRLKSVW